ncbi:autophagy-related protein 18f, partial [Tanacetum coccineum]
CGSRWINISSTRGTSHLVVIAPSRGPVNIQSTEESVNSSHRGYNYDATNKPADRFASGPPITLSPINRIRNGNSGCRNVVTGAALAAFDRMNSYSNVIASIFHIMQVIVRDVVSKAIIAQFKTHGSPIASLCFDPSGAENGASYIVFTGFNVGLQMRRWINISSSRGTSHLFAIAPSRGPVNIQSAEESVNSSHRGYNYDATNKPADRFASGPPITLSPVSRIRNGNSGCRNVVTGAALAAFDRMNSYSNVIASTFHIMQG